ncbi:IBH1-LIKE 1 [Hibiscus trionum]|uniref:IBH1-LIKE 1 n=1 Tax=Hibiscus trionum TaxID=183268 RepID=A0A9W7J6D9_HIBTR|nr:IBH1-LIKE 1 [Hibiscus trionum]
MRPCSSLKREFLKKWIISLQRCSSPNKDMSILERKRAIKLSADVAMAAARNGATCWSRALIADAHSKHGTDGKHLVSNSMEYRNKRIRISKKILKRSCRLRRRRRSKCAAQMARAGSILKGLVRQRTRILKSLIPGGESMNEASLVEETLDYITSLQAQVAGMRSLVCASELSR